MKKLGVIGGLGPDTTAKFYADVVNECKKFNRFKTPPVTIESVSAEYSLYEDVIVKNQNIDGFLPYLLDAAQVLDKEGEGADILVMPCNTLHVHMEKIREAVRNSLVKGNIKIMSITEEAGKFLEEEGVERVGIVSTAATVENRLYEQEFEKRNIKYASPNKEDQKILNEIVIRLVYGNPSDEDKELLVNIMEKFDDMDCVLLACTDLQLLNPKIEDTKIHDTMKILVKSAVREILKGTRKNIAKKQIEDITKYSSLAEVGSNKLVKQNPFVTLYKWDSENK